MGIASTLRFIWEHPLNRPDRPAALARWASWQLGARLAPGPIAIPYIDDTVLLVRRGMNAATGNWYCGLQEYEEMAFVLHALLPGNVLLDIGANIGSYTVLAAGACGASVIAIEPVPSTAAALEANIRLNGLESRVTVKRASVGAEIGTLRITSELDACNRIAADDEHEGVIQVPALTVDGLCANRVPTIIKIDVEGYELPVLQGAEATLRNPEVLAVVAETNGSGERYRYADATVVQLLTDAGFAPHGYDPVTRTLLPPLPHSVITVFVRDAGRMGDRLRNAPVHRLVNGNI